MRRTVLTWLKAGIRILAMAMLRLIGENPDHEMLGALSLTEDVLDLVVPARMAVIYAEKIGHSPGQKHAIATRHLAKQFPAASARDVSLAVVISHRRTG